MVVGRRPGPLDELGKEIAEVSGGKAQAFVFPLNVAEPQLMARAVKDFVNDVGGVDVLVANAGINPQRANATKATDAAWQETFGSMSPEFIIVAKPFYRTWKRSVRAPS